MRVYKRKWIWDLFYIFFGCFGLWALYTQYFVNHTWQRGDYVLILGSLVFIYSLVKVLKDRILYNRIVCTEDALIIQGLFSKREILYIDMLEMRFYPVIVRHRLDRYELEIQLLNKRELFSTYGFHYKDLIEIGKSLYLHNVRINVDKKLDAYPKITNHNEIYRLEMKPEKVKQANRKKYGLLVLVIVLPIALLAIYLVALVYVLESDLLWLLVGIFILVMICMVALNKRTDQAFVWGAQKEMLFYAECFTFGQGRNRHIVYYNQIDTITFENYRLTLQLTDHKLKTIQLSPTDYNPDDLVKVNDLLWEHRYAK